jgi:G3E family GTPase
MQQLAEEREDGSPNEAQKQVACADVILLNKTDLVSSEQLDGVASAVSAINPTLRVHRTLRGNVPLAELFDLRAFASPTAAAAALPDVSACGCSNADGEHNHDHSAHVHGANAVATVSIPLPPTISAAQFEKVNAVLEALLWKRTWPSPDTAEGTAPDVLRTKGYAVLDDESARLIQGVSDLFEVRELPHKGDVEPKLVFIGRGVDGRLIENVRASVGI